MERERDIELQLARLATSVDAGFSNWQRRMDAQDKTLSAIEEQVRETNGRVTRHDEQILQIQRAMAMAANAASHSTPMAIQKADDDAVTVERVKQFASFGGWIVAAGLGLLKLMGKL